MTETGTNGEARTWVAALADPSRRDAAFAALVALGPAARAAVHEGLGDGRWEVRRWCLYWLLRFAAAEDAVHVAPLVRDPRARVRHVAMVVLRLAGGAAGGSEVVPMLLERALEDESLRVRRQAVLLLAWEFAHPDLENFFADLLARERDPTLHKYAGMGLVRCRAAEAQPC
jgi:HEAT repeat protein